MASDSDLDGADLQVAFEPFDSDEVVAPPKKKRRTESAKGTVTAVGRAEDDDDVKAKEKGRKRKTVGGQRPCRACGTQHPVLMFPSGSQYCAWGKRVTQNLMVAAVAQNRVAWLKHIFADDEKLKRLVAWYEMKCGPEVRQRVEGTNKKGKVPRKKRPELLEFIQEQREEEALMADGTHEFMNLPGYQHWLSKPRNGCIDSETAKSRWEALCADPLARTNELAHHPKHKLQVLVKYVKQTIIERNSQIKGQSFKTTEMIAKNADEDDIDGAAKRLQHETMRGTRCDMAFEDRVVGLTAGWAATSCSDLHAAKGAATVGDLGAFDFEVSDDAEDENDGDAPVPAAQGGEEPATPATPKPKQKAAPWFDRDGAVSTELKAFDTWFDKTHLTLSTLLDKMTETKQRACSDEIGMSDANEVKLLQTRMTAVQLLLAKSKTSTVAAAAAAAPVCTSTSPVTELQSKETKVEDGDGNAKQLEGFADFVGLKDRLSPATLAASADGGGGTADAQLPQHVATDVDSSSASSSQTPKRQLQIFLAGFSQEGAKMRGTMGSAPPCRSYRLLRTMEDLKAWRAGIESAMQKEEIQSNKSRFNPYRLAVQDLITMAKAAEVRLSKAVADKRAAIDAQTHEAKATEDSKRKKGGGKGAATAASSDVHCWDHACTFGRPVVEYTFAQDACIDVDMAVPGLIKLPPETLPDDSPLAQTAEKLAERFKTDPARKSPGRAQRKVSEDAATQLKALTSQIFGDKLFQKYPASVCEAVPDIVFAVAKNQKVCGAEANFLGTLRLGTHGTRQMILAHVNELRIHLESEQVGTEVQMSKIYNALGNLTPSWAKAYTCGSKRLLYASMGPRDALYLPDGWAFCEIIGGQDYVGFRQLASAANAATIESLEMVNEHMLVLKRPNSGLQAALDAIHNDMAD